MLKRVFLTLRTERVGVDAELFDTLGQAIEGAELSAALIAPARDEKGQSLESETMELFSRGRLRLSEDTFSLSYEESELTEMQGCQTQLSFRLAQRDLVSLTRSGSVATALVFEPGKRHTSIYQTPYMPFEVCVHTLSVDNRLALDEGNVGGTLELDYIIEIRGAQAERCRMRLDVRQES